MTRDEAAWRSNVRLLSAAGHQLHCSASEAATVRTQRYNNTGDERLAPTPQCEGSSNVCVDVEMQLCCGVVVML